MKQFQVEYDVLSEEIVNGVLTDKVYHTVQVFDEEFYNKVIPLLASAGNLKNITVKEVGQA